MNKYKPPEVIYFQSQIDYSGNLCYNLSINITSGYVAEHEKINGPVHVDWN